MIHIIPYSTEPKTLLLMLALTLPRMLAAFSVLPFLSKSVLPGLIRNSLVISLSIIVVPLVEMDFPSEPLTTLRLVGLIVKEVFLGLGIGYLVAIPFWALGTIGFFIDTQRGVTMASAFVPLLGDQTSPLGAMLSQTVTLLFVVSGGLLIFLDAFYHSYQTWPLFSFYPQLDLHQGTLFFLRQLDGLMYLTVFLAGPVILIMFLVEMGLALISRFVPELNVFFLALPIKGGIAIFVLIFYGQHLIGFFCHRFAQIDTIFVSLDGLFR